jgi:hypothetical protein
MNEHRFLDGYIVEAETNGANRRIVVRTWWTFQVRTVIYANYLALCCSAASITTMSLYSKVSLRCQGVNDKKLYEELYVLSRLQILQIKKVLSHMNENQMASV